MPAFILGLRGADSFLPTVSLRRLQGAVWGVHLVAVAATLLVAVASALDSRSTQMANAHRQSLSLARALDQQTAGLLAAATEYLLGTRAVIEHNGGVNAISKARLEQLVEGEHLKHGAFRRVLLADENGVPRGSAEEPPTAVVRDREWFRSASANPDRAVRIYLPIRSVVDGKWFIPVAVRIDKPDGSFGGALRVGIDAQYLADFYQSLGIDPGSSVALVRDDGAFLMRYPDFDRIAGRRMRSTNLEHLRGTEGTFEAVWSSDNTARVVAFRKVEKYPIYLTVGLASETILGRWQRNNYTRGLIVLGVIVLLTIFARVLSRRLEGEAVATTSLAHFANAVDRNADLVFWIGSDGRFLYANESALEQLGCSRERMTTLSVRDVCPDYSQEAWSRAWRALCEKGDLRIETDALTRNGHRFPIGIAATRVAIEGEAYAFAIARDLTEQRHSEAAIRALNRTLEDKVLERTRELELANASLASFSDAVSHDLRAPLWHLSSYADILAAQLESVSGPPRQLVDRIGERARHMEGLIVGLLGLSRVGCQALEMRELDLSALANEEIRDLERETPGRRVEVSIQDGLRALGDPVLVRALFRNLLGNAWKYSSRTQNAKVQVACDYDSGEAVFRVQDNGTGFDPRYAAKLFGAFQRLHSQSDFPGTGIGLATAKRIVERHGGRIWAESKPGVGATFYFTLAPHRAA